MILMSVIEGRESISLANRLLQVSMAVPRSLSKLNRSFENWAEISDYLAYFLGNRATIAFKLVQIYPRSTKFSLLFFKTDRLLET